MEITQLIDQLDADGPRFADAVRTAGWDAPVPGTEWDARTLLIHMAAVHRWATDAMRRSLPTNETGGSSAFHDKLPDDERLDWFTEGHATLVATLRAAGPDLQAFTFLPADSPLHFWARRQAHETTVHRFDAEAAAGRSVTDVDADFAQDGIAEMVLGWGRGRSFAPDRTATLALVAADGPSWLITFGGERNVAEPSDGVDGADAQVAGRSSELYRWLWNRPAPVQVTGDDSVAALWSRVRIS